MKKALIHAFFISSEYNHKKNKYHARKIERDGKRVAICTPLHILLFALLISVCPL